jgi:hypothetical protein
MCADSCGIKTINGAYVQDNGIIRLSSGLYIGRLDGVEYSALQSEESPTKSPNIRMLAQDRAQIAGVVACGWCSAKNENKTMDPDLAEAIVDELLRQLQHT